MTWLLILLSPALSLASEYKEQLLVINDDSFSDHQAIKPRIQIYTGPIVELEALVEQSITNRQWQTIKAVDLPFFDEGSPWYRFSLHNDTTEIRNLVVNFPVSPLQNLAVSYVHNQQVTQRFLTGVWQAQQDRPIDYSQFAMPLVLQPGEEVSVYMQVATSPKRILGSLAVFNQVDFYAFQARNAALYGTHIGLGVAVILFNFILVLVLKEIRYLWFILFAAGQILIIAALGGKSTTVLLNIAPSLVPHEILLYGAFASIGIVLFANTILDLKQQAPLVYRIALYAAISMTLMTLYSVFAIQSMYRFIILALPAAVIFAIIAFYAIRKSLHGDTAVRLFTLGVLLPLIAIAYLSYDSIFQGLLLNHSYDASLLLLCMANLLRIGNLKRKEEMAQLASESKSQFISQLSHEIRNPMNGIVGMSQLLLNSEQNEEDHKRTRIIYQSASSLLSILNDVLDYSKISANQMQLERIPFELSSLLMSSSEIYRSQCESQNTSLEVKIDPKLSRYFYGDPGRISQILSNLLSNAVKFTENGHIFLSVNSEHNGTLCFAVSDDGIGIARSQIKHLFKEYQQARPSIARQFGGTGLGLPICQRLAKLMNAEIQVSSEAGMGSTFSLLIPLEAAPDDSQALNHQSTIEPLSKPLHILFAEDNTVNSLVLSSLLKVMNCSFTATTNGREAFNCYLNSLKTDSPAFDCILMDCEMPILGGIETTELIRQHERQQQLSHPIPIIALTGHVMPEYVERCRRAGMNKVLTKPIDTEALAKSLKNLH